LLNADTINKCNRLSIRKLLKAKKVNTRMTPHAQQNDERWARGHVVKQLKMKGSHIEDLEDNVTLQKKRQKSRRCNSLVGSTQPHLEEIG
jgi:hypothetical protein